MTFNGLVADNFLILIIGKDGKFKTCSMHKINKVYKMVVQKLEE
jgi:hypothetical protein